MAWPTSSFPTSLDTITDKISSDDIVANDINGAYDCIEKLQVKLGINSSADTTSIDYLLKHASSVNPGHKHTLAAGATDITAAAANINDICGSMSKDTDGTMAANSDSRYATQKAIVTYAAPKSHAVNASTYGYGTDTLAGHFRYGTGLTASTGTLAVSYGSSAGTACVGNDARLSNSRTPTAHTFDSASYHTVSGLVTGHFLKATGATSFAFAAHGLTYTDVGAAPTSHAVNASTYGYGDGTNAGHLRVGTGLTISTGTVSVTYGTTAATSCQGDDSRLSDSRTPTAHTLTGALHTASGLTTGHFLKATGTGTFAFAAHGLTYTDVGAPPTSHAANAATYGYGDGTNAGHLRVGTGLTVSTGTVSVLYSTGADAGYACQANDSRLSDARTPVSHAVNASTYGYGDGTNAGHLRVGTGLSVAGGTVSVTYGVAASTSCQGNDSRLSDARTPVSHAVNASTYGYGDSTNAGHFRYGTGLTASSGTLSVLYSTGADAGYACQANDSRLSNSRTPTAHTFDSGTYHIVSGLTPGHFLKATGAGTFAFAAHGLTYTDVSAAPTSHAVNASTYGYGDGTNAGHLRVGTGLTISTGTVSVTYGTTAGTSCVGNDSRLSDSRTPTSHSLTSSHTVTGLTTGHFLKATGASSFAFAAHGLTYSDVGAPSTTGTNASGTGWNISILGSSASCTGNSATATTATYATYLWSTSHPGEYYVSAAYNGSYWRLSSNHSDTVSVQHATVSSSCSGNAATATSATSATTAGTCSGNAATASSCTGNAATATALQSARTIGGVSFDGTANITVASATSGFSVTGDLVVTGNISAYYSDDRLKTRYSNITQALWKVTSLNGFYFTPNETAQKMGIAVVPDVGVSAQEVLSVLPEAVAPAPIDSDYMTVRYERLIPLLIEAIKELKDEIDELKRK